MRAKTSLLSRTRALGAAEKDLDALARKKRGHFAGVQVLRFEWTGTADPPDLLPIARGAELVSRRMLDRLIRAGIRGLGELPAGVKLPDSTVADYSLLVAHHEVESICFRRSAHSVGPDTKLYALREPVITGLNAEASDIYLLPYELGMHSVIVSTRFMELAQRADMSNAEFVPVAQLEVLLPDPDQVLC